MEQRRRRRYLKDNGWRREIEMRESEMRENEMREIEMRESEMREIEMRESEMREIEMRESEMSARRGKESEWRESARGVRERVERERDQLVLPPPGLAGSVDVGRVPQSQRHCRYYMTLITQYDFTCYQCLENFQRH
jgi:hypothetical protein